MIDGVFCMGKHQPYSSYKIYLRTPHMNLVEQSVHFVLLSNVVQYSNMGDEKKKEIKIEKKDEFGNTVEETEIEEKEED